MKKIKNLLAVAVLGVLLVTPITDAYATTKWKSTNTDKVIADYNASKYESRKAELAKLGISYSGEVSALDSVFLSAMEYKKTGWVYTSVDDIRYMKDGEPVKGWSKGGDNVAWRYYDLSTGIMKTGWLWEGNKWYYLYSDGWLACNQYVDGHYMAVDGHWDSSRDMDISLRPNNKGAVAVYLDSTASHWKFISDAEFSQLKSSGKVGVQVSHSEGQSGISTSGLDFYLK